MNAGNWSFKIGHCNHQIRTSCKLSLKKSNSGKHRAHPLSPWNILKHQPLLRETCDAKLRYHVPNLHPPSPTCDRNCWVMSSWCWGAYNFWPLGHLHSTLSSSWASKSKSCACNITPVVANFLGLESIREGTAKKTSIHHPCPQQVRSQHPTCAELWPSIHNEMLPMIFYGAKMMNVDHWTMERFGVQRP